MSLTTKTFYNPNLYVISGGPGVGKTSIIAELQKRGYNCIDEVARKIIKEQMESGGDALPWSDTRKYTEQMLIRSIESYLENKNNLSFTFFDRGIPDTLAYSNLIRLDILPQLQEAVNKYRYNETIFLLPPWKEIYQTDNERKQSFREAVDTYEIMKETYSKCGYNIINIPTFSIIKRVDFLLQQIK